MPLANQAILHLVGIYNIANCYPIVQEVEYRVKNKGSQIILQYAGI